MNDNERLQVLIKNDQKNNKCLIKKPNSRINKMKAQFSCLITLALLGASMVQFVDAAVCPEDTSTCTNGNGNGVKMCKRKTNGVKKNTCVTNPKIQRNILKRGGSCGVCPNDNGNGNGNGNNKVRCSASSEAEMCVNGKGARGYYMNNGSKTVCVKDRLTIDRQDRGLQCGCYRGVCPSTCPARFDCSNGDGSFMCIEKSNNGSVTLCVDKTAVQTKQDLGLGTCGPC